MPSVPPSPPALASVAKRLARRLLATGSNRLELLTLELQLERDRVLEMAVVALGLAALGLLTAISVSALIVLAFWNYSPWLGLLLLSLLYATGAAMCAHRLSRLGRDCPIIPRTVEQWRKDQACIENILG